jgi:hypothetical protein
MALDAIKTVVGNKLPAALMALTDEALELPEHVTVTFHPSGSTTIRSLVRLRTPCIRRRRVSILIDMVVALKPLRTATGMDKTTLDDLEDGVVHGALQHLLVMPTSTWTELEPAVYHAKQNIYKVAERRVRTTFGSGRTSLTIQQQPWA